MSLVSNLQLLITAIADQMRPSIITVSTNLGTAFRQKIVVNSALATTQTLPAATVGKEIQISNIGTGLVTVARAGTDLITGVQNRLLFPAQFVRLSCAVAGTWTISDVTCQFRTVLGASVINNNAVANTLADVTGLSFAVFANVTYKFRAEIGYNSAVITTGARWAMNGPVSSKVRYYFENTEAASGAVTQNYYTAYNTVTVGAINSLLTGNIALGYGVLMPTANGTVVVRFASEVANSAITALLAESFIEWAPIGTTLANTGVF